MIYEYPLRLYLVVAVTSICLSGCGWLGDAREKAQAAFDRGDLAAARIEATNAVSDHPEQPAAYVLLGRILTEVGDFPAAERALKKVVELGGEAAVAEPLRGQALKKMQAYQRIIDELPAEPQYKGASRASVLAARGRALLALNRVDEAKSSFAAAEKEVASFPDALLGNALLAALGDDRTTAMKLVDQVLAALPRYADAWMLKASLLRASNAVDDAVSAYERWAQADPTSLLPRLSAAELLIEANRLPEARKQIDAVLARAPGSVLANTALARWHIAQRSYDKAIESLQTALKAQPEHEPAGRLMAFAQFATGAFNQADERLRVLLKSAPGDIALRRLHAATLLAMGNARGALDTLTPVMQAGADDPMLLSIAAEAHFRLKEYAKATAYLERAARASPDDPNTAVRLARARIAGGDAAVGLKELEQAARADSASPTAEFALVLALLDQRSYDKALTAARALQVKHPRNPIGFNLAGIAQVRLNDMGNARKSFEQAIALDKNYWPAVGNLARLELAAGKKDAAIALIERAASDDRSNLEAQVALAELSSNRGRYVRVLEELRKADVKALAPRLMLAREYLSHGLGDLALGAAREATAIAPTDATAIELLGSAQLLTEQRSDALSTFRRLASDYPRSLVAQLRLGQAHLALGDARSAEAAFGKALAIAPDNAEALVSIAQIHGQTGRFDEAMKVADKLRSSSPRSPIGYALAGDLSMVQGKHPDAIKAYEAGVAATAAGALILKLHAAQTAAGRNPSLAPLTAWLDKHPETAEMRVYLASRQHAAGALAEAAENYRKVIAVNPYNALALNNLADIYARLQDKRALETAESAYRLKPDDADVMDTYGVVLSREGRHEAALDMLKKARARKPDSASIKLDHALALARAGKAQTARIEYDALLASGAKIELDQESRALLGQR